MKVLFLGLIALALTSAVLNHHQSVQAQTPQCLPPPGQTVNDFVDVQTLNPDGFAGPATSTNYRPTGEILTVHINSSTHWLGDVQSLADVRVGVRLQVTGTRQPDCSIVAINVLSSAVTTPTPQPGTTPGQSLPATGTGSGGNFSPSWWELLALAVIGLTAITVILTVLGTFAARALRQ